MAGKPDNVRYQQTSLKEFNSFVCSKLDIEINLEEYPYKFCDMKPSLAYLYPDAIADYDFWGYGDLDVIYGNISTFITPEILNEYDIVSTLEKALGAHFCLLRNTPTINNLFFESKDYKWVFQDSRIFSFDEFGWGVHEDFEHMTLIASRAQSENRLKIYCKRTLVANLGLNALGVYKWEDGRLSEFETNREIMYCHLLRWKKYCTPDFSPADAGEGWTIGYGRGIHRYSNSLNLKIQLSSPFRKMRNAPALLQAGVWEGKSQSLAIKFVKRFNSFENATKPAHGLADKLQRLLHRMILIIVSQLYLLESLFADKISRLSKT